MSKIQMKPINDADLKELKSRMKLIADADPSQYHNDFSLKRYLRAFKNADDAFKVSCNNDYISLNIKVESLHRLF